MVVEYPEDPQIDGATAQGILHKSWISKQNGQMYGLYPAYLKTEERIRKAVLVGMDLDVLKSQLCKVNIKFHSDKYDSAVRAMKQLCIVTDVESSDVNSDINKRRRLVASNDINYMYGSLSSESDIPPTSLIYKTSAASSSRVMNDVLIMEDTIVADTLDCAERVTEEPTTGNTSLSLLTSCLPPATLLTCYYIV